MGLQGQDLASVVGRAVGGVPGKEPAEQQCGLGEEQWAVLELRQHRGCRGRGRVLLRALPRPAASRPRSGLLQPHALVRAARRGVAGRRVGLLKAGVTPVKACRPLIISQPGD